MGTCWCSDKRDDENENENENEEEEDDDDDVVSEMNIQPGPSSAVTPMDIATTEFCDPCCRLVNPFIVDKLILEMLSLITSFIDNDEESPVPLMKLHALADKEEGWIQVVSSMVNVIPLEDPLGPSVITIVFDDCPLPAKESVIKLTKIFQLTKERAMKPKLDVRTERNICILLGCIAEKLAGPNSVAILTTDTLEYLLTLLSDHKRAHVVLFSLIALEKFAHTTENKITIKQHIEKLPENPLLKLERLAHCKDYMWRQVGFCAQWALDNLFVVEDRELSCKSLDMSAINVILNSEDVSEYLKISSSGLEARCDSYSFESVRTTFQVDSGSWYYECQVITPGVMQIGWATKNSRFLNHEGYGIGDDLYSLAYDGCRRLLWYKAKPSVIMDMHEWRSGDILGCFLDLDNKMAVFTLNGVSLPPYKEIFETTQQGFFAAASFMAFQQCRFNFGHEPFLFPPKRPFTCLNDHATLTEERKKVLPRRFYLEQLKNTVAVENSCTLCFAEPACCTIEPCAHNGLCSVCSAQLKECPFCRGPILNVKKEDA